MCWSFRLFGPCTSSISCWPFSSDHSDSSINLQGEFFFSLLLLLLWNFNSIYRSTLFHSPDMFASDVKGTGQESIWQTITEPGLVVLGQKVHSFTDPGQSEKEFQMSILRFSQWSG